MLLGDFVGLVQGLPFRNLDLLSVGIAIAAIGILGFLIYLNNPRSTTNRAFLLFAVATVFWSFLNYVSYQTNNLELVLWLQRFAIFLGVWHAFTFFRFAYIFPSETKILPPWFTDGIFPFTVILSFATLTPFVFSGVFARGAIDAASIPQPEPLGIIAFLGGVFALILGGIFILTKKTLSAKRTDRSSYVMMLIGAIIMFAFILIFSAILPALFLNVRFIPLGALYVFPFVIFTAYSVYEHRLFSVQNIFTALLTFFLCAVVFFQIIFATNPTDVLLRVSIFILALVISIQLVRNTFQLEAVNRQQESLLHFISHEVKGYLTKGQAGFASIIEGDYGKISGNLNTMAQGALNDMRKGVNTVMDILDASNMRKGTMTYNKTGFDFKESVNSVIEQLSGTMAEKGLLVETHIANGNYWMDGDEAKLHRHVIRNLIDNAVRYTLKGTITIDLTRTNNTIRFSVKDTGIGITPKDMEHLFTEGGKGKDSTKINVDSTGYGLFVAKSVVEAHGGKVWAESEGEGKGSTFIAELPSKS